MSEAHPLPSARVMHPLLSAFCEALATLIAMLATMYCAWKLNPSPFAMVLATVLCLSLSRSLLDRDWRGRLEAAWALPLVGLAAVGVGTLLHRLPWLGATIFTGALGASVWLRRFGSVARRAGALISLPMIALLTVPHAPVATDAHFPAWLAPILVALIALLWVSLAQAVLRWLRVLPPVPMHVAATSTAARQSKLKPDAPTRMAIQMVVALGLAFIVGFTFFGMHWSWPVLTAFIVNSGNRGRLDVIHKSLLRMLGAAAGTAMASLLPAHLLGSGQITASLILAALFFGTWLRRFGYAWWALFVTLALSLLQDFIGIDGEHAMPMRLLGILVGALIGVAAAWFVLPVKSEGVVRRYIADALAALSNALDPANASHGAHAFDRAMQHLEVLMPAFKSNRFLARMLRRKLPAADWCRQLLCMRDDARAAIQRANAPANLRRTVGVARKALLEPATLSDALRQLHVALEQAHASATTASNPAN